MSRTFAFLLAVASAFLTLVVTVGCGGGGSGGDGQATLTIYSGRSEAMVGPLIERFEQETGIRVTVNYDRTPVIAQVLQQEGAQSPADVFFAQDPGYLGALADAGMLAELDESLFEHVDERMRDADRRWVGTSGRLRVLTYNPNMIAEEQLPRSLEEMADPRFDRMSWAPQNGSLQAHLSALRHIWGEEQTREFVSNLRDKNAERFQSNRPQVSAVANGDVAFAWVNHYYLHALGGEARTNARNYSFPASSDNAGNVMMVAGAGILETSRNKEAAQKFIEFLLSEETQTFFAQTNYEYPTRKGIQTHADVTPLSEIALADVPQTALADVRTTVTMLQELGAMD